MNIPNPHIKKKDQKEENFDTRSLQATTIETQCHLKSTALSSRRTVSELAPS